MVSVEAETRFEVNNMVEQGVQVKVKVKGSRHLTRGGDLEEPWGRGLALVEAEEGLKMVRGHGSGGGRGGGRGT